MLRPRVCFGLFHHSLQGGRTPGYRNYRASSQLRPQGSTGLRRLCMLPISEVTVSFTSVTLKCSTAPSCCSHCPRPPFPQWDGDVYNYTWQGQCPFPTLSFRVLVSIGLSMCHKSCGFSVSLPRIWFCSFRAERLSGSQHF